MSSVPYSYIAYIDESGDPGLQRVKPLDANGSSEWFILSAVVIGEPNEKNVAPWRNDILRATNSQRKDLHFTNLKPWNKRIACTEMAKLCRVAFCLKDPSRKHPAWGTSPGMTNADAVRVSVLN
jgi:hypothetical protein